MGVNSVDSSAAAWAESTIAAAEAYAADHNDAVLDRPNQDAPADGAAPRALEATDDVLSEHVDGTNLEGRTSIDDGLYARTGAYGHTDMNGNVTVDPKAFGSSGLLDYVLDHESVHVDQVDSGNFHAFPGSVEEAVNEIEAYKTSMTDFQGQAATDPVLDAAIGDAALNLSDQYGRIEGSQYENQVVSGHDYTLHPVDDGGNAGRVLPAKDDN
jgi:hypothetical protein